MGEVDFLFLCLYVFMSDVLGKRYYIFRQKDKKTDGWDLIFFVFMSLCLIF